MRQAYEKVKYAHSKYHNRHNAMDASYNYTAQQYNCTCLYSSKSFIACGRHILEHVAFVKHCIMELHSFEHKSIIE